MPFDLTAIIGEFRDEADQHIEMLNARLLELERDPTATEPIRAMFLSAHTIKGSAAMLDLPHISLLAHAIEDVLAYLRDERRPLDHETAELLFTALDMLRALISAPILGAEEPSPAILELSTALRGHAMDQVVDKRTSAIPPQVGPAPRALLLDDSATVRLLETMQLQEAGFEVDIVEDGLKALSLAVAEPYDLLVTGIECEGLRGWDLVAALREVLSSRSMPIIVMSSDRHSDQRDIADAGVYAYLPKGSLHRSELADTAQRLLTERGAATARKERV
jgi:CheY-like chemotaxis protein/HPt (histidine-containing phosphotransfer) domain-containing protein